MICLACALERKIKIDPKGMVLGYCKHCGNYRVVGEAKV